MPSLKSWRLAMQMTVISRPHRADAQVHTRLGLQHEGKVFVPDDRLHVAHQPLGTDEAFGDIAGKAGLVAVVECDANRCGRTAPPPRAAEPCVTALHRSARRRSFGNCPPASKVCTVPTSVTSPGPTLMASRSLARIAHRLSTATSMGRVLRKTMPCATAMMWAATSSGSTVW